MATKTTNKNAHGKAKLPVKKSVNFAHLGEKKINWLIAIPGILIIIVLACLLSKVSIYDRYQKLSELKKQRNELQTEQAALYDAVNSYGDIEAEFAHYTYDSFTSDELNMLDRARLLKLIDEQLLAKAYLSSWSVSGNMMVVNITGVTLEEVSAISKTLETLPEVSFCMVSNARTQEGSQNVAAVMSIYLQQVWGEE